MMDPRKIRACWLMTSLLFLGLTICIIKPDFRIFIWVPVLLYALILAIVFVILNYVPEKEQLENQPINDVENQYRNANQISNQHFNLTAMTIQFQAEECAAMSKVSQGLDKKQIEQVAPESIQAGVDGENGTDDGCIEETCAVCLEPVGLGCTKRILTGCGHEYHSLCISRWLMNRPTCPLCNAVLIPRAIATNKTREESLEVIVLGGGSEGLRS